MSKSFEENMEKLEKIVADLEKGDLDLDESVKKFEQGINISKKCDEILKNAEKNGFGIAKTKEGEAEINDYEVLQEARDILKKNGRSEWKVMRNASY